MGMIYHSSSGDDSYHILDSLTLKCPFEAEAVRSALNDMMDAHPVLRTSFDLGTFSEPLQLVHKNIAAPFQHLDLRDAPEAVRNTILKEFLEYQKVEYFDLTKVPLARFYIHALTNETLQFTFTHHHAILDGWSVNTLFVDIINRYFEYLSGSEKAMTAQPCPAMQHLVTLERAALKSEETFRYWRDIIGKTTSPQAKLAKASLANTTAAPAKDVVSHDSRLPSDLSKNLHEVAATLRVPVKSVCPGRAFKGPPRPLRKIGSHNGSGLRHTSRTARCRSCTRAFPQYLAIEAAANRGNLARPDYRNV